MSEKAVETVKKEVVGDISPETSNSVIEGEELSRKRTRDDFESEEDSKHNEEKENQAFDINHVKRRKDISEIKGAGSIAGPAEGESEKKEATDEAEVEAEEQKKDQDGLEKGLIDVQLKSNEPLKDSEKDADPKGEINQSIPEIKDKTVTENSAKETSSDNNKEEKPKFVFGASTSFGSNKFSLINSKKNVFESLPGTNPKSALDSSKASTVPVFGSNSKFGDAFKSAIKKENIFEKTVESNDKEADQEESKPKANLYKQVDLKETKVKSGEENEEQVFTCRAKLYALDLTDVKAGWKERGVGAIHVNRSKENGNSSRVIMRSNGLLKVILNTALVKGLEVIKGFPSSLSSEKFIRITSLENNKPIQYALKTGNADTTSLLYDSIIALIPKDV